MRLAGLGAVAVVLVAVLSACVGSGKVATADELGTLPDGVHVVYDTTMGCRDGESGFDYRFVVLGGTTDLNDKGPLLAGMRAQGYYHSQGIPDDLTWITVAYQHWPDADETPYPLRAEIGRLDRYLADPVHRTGPDPASLPADVRDHPEQYLLVAMRPTDFACATPL